jgi:antitoxin ParD1/3/4
MATMNVSLPDPMKTWVEAQIKTGHYSNASDYVRDLIRRDQDYQTKRETLIKALIAGENSGDAASTLEDIWRDVKARHTLDV